MVDVAVIVDTISVGVHGRVADASALAGGLWLGQGSCAYEPQNTTFFLSFVIVFPCLAHVV